ncbi:MED6 mediator subfamily complex component-domain-containing protein [Lipomyces chichibuensis]|uniref:MED6 mediator subfamily complex component-domain-containing protein n=1 Tax=Lipomyces chichibuensis TaxID=1546026 RepID=UPI003343B7A7
MSEQPALDELQWRAPEWIQIFGLRTDNVLEYFAQSPFYDRSSNNQVLKMQSQFNAPVLQPQEVVQALSTMRGIEFAIAMAQPASALWIIRKQNRISPSEAVPLATYFVINENIYMAPSVYSIVSSRMLAGIRGLREALVLAADKLPKFAPTLGYSYYPNTQEDEENAKERVQEQMMARALANARQFEIEQEYLDMPKKEAQAQQTQLHGLQKATGQTGLQAGEKHDSGVVATAATKRRRKKEK